MQAVNYSEFRTHMKEYCDRAEKEEDIVVITRKKGAGNGIYMPLEVFNNLMQELSSYRETSYVLSGTANKEHLMESIEEHKRRKVKKMSLEALEELKID